MTACDLGNEQIQNRIKTTLLTAKKNNDEDDNNVSNMMTTNYAHAVITTNVTQTMQIRRTCLVLIPASEGF